MIKNNINNKVYIGQTKRHYKKRFSDHMNSLMKNKHKNAHLQAAWNKYGKNNFSFTTLDQVAFKSGLNNLEKFWINYYKSNNINHGYNLTNGGDSTEFSDIARLNMSNAQKRFFATEKGKAHLKKMSEKLKGKKPWNIGTKGVCKAWNRGVKLGSQSIELIQKRALAISKAKMGKKTNIPSINAKKVICIETNEIFNSILEAANYYGGRREHLRDHLNGKIYRKKFKGLTFKEIKETNNGI